MSSQKSASNISFIANFNSFQGNLGGEHFGILNVEDSITLNHAVGSRQSVKSVKSSTTFDAFDTFDALLVNRAHCSLVCVRAKERNRSGVEL